jgi:hypothetical protein
MPFVESDEWFMCGAPARQSQGWKLYVSLTILNAAEIVERLVPVVQRYGLHFKYVKSIDLLHKLNAGAFGYTQIGKCFVIYVPEPDAAFVAELKRALAPYRGQCPAVPCALPFGADLPLYYRYGSYQGSRIEVGSVEFEDNRGDARHAVPAGVADLFAPHVTPIPEDADVRSFLFRYPAYEAITQQGKCGVFRALNLECEVFQEVILKVGYHRGQVQPDGRDGCDFLRRELAFYRKLKRRGLAHLAPRLVDALDVSRKVILVLECVPGTDLLERNLEGALTTEHLNRCWEIMDELRDGGVYLGDAKLANFLLTEGEELRVVDFEAAGVAGQKPLPMLTYLVDPHPLDPFVADRAHFLASVLFHYEASRDNWDDRYIDLRACASIKPRTDVEAWAVDKLRSVMRDLT